ncbi:hypothetical protein F5X68DRAFT_26976 [Plectosphaerella plurivora]|uniref:Uncharacterized protein n=1 Tax=Plectosphaerella plurivora TaxID=936078 RepID=A0A9P8V804_9PEZI|nr:hypothetical protein F5X68DRAFT_26976 [Plectosphaerella plurivora]
MAWGGRMKARGPGAFRVHMVECWVVPSTTNHQHGNGQVRAFLTAFSLESPHMERRAIVASCLAPKIPPVVVCLQGGKRGGSRKANPSHAKGKRWVSCAISFSTPDSIFLLLLRGPVTALFSPPQSSTSTLSQWMGDPHHVGLGVPIPLFSIPCFHPKGPADCALRNVSLPYPWRTGTVRLGLWMTTKLLFLRASIDYSSSCRSPEAAFCHGLLPHHESCS